MIRGQRVADAERGRRMNAHAESDLRAREIGIGERDERAELVAGDHPARDPCQRHIVVAARVGAESSTRVPDQSKISALNISSGNTYRLFCDAGAMSSLPDD